jgi:glycosyltransferase involved in cell wall biosynthesis
MKILLLTNKSPWPPKDGGAAATLAMIKGLTACGASVTVVALNTLKHFVSPENIPQDFRLKNDLKLVNSDTRIKPLRLLVNLLLSRHPYTLERFESEEFKKVVESVNPGRFDIIQLEGLAMTNYISFLRQVTGTKIVYRPHNIENRIWYQLAGFEKNFLKKYYFRLLASRTANVEMTIMNKVDGIATITGKDLEWFENFGLRKPSVVCHSGFPASKQEIDEKENYNIFFIGSLDWLPNIDGLNWFVKYVWPSVTKAFPGALFHVAGRNPSAEISKICTGHNIFFHGEVESSSEFMAGKQIMVVPLFAGSGLRMKIVEGMSLGKTIVSTAVAADGVECCDGKDIFIRTGATEFAECLISLLRNGSLQKETSAHAMENVRKNYDIFASAEKLMTFYSELA